MNKRSHFTDKVRDRVRVRVRVEVRVRFIPLDVGLTKIAYFLSYV
jgi:hypothetical protein